MLCHYFLIGVTYIINNCANIRTYENKDPLYAFVQIYLEFVNVICILFIFLNK